MFNFTTSEIMEELYPLDEIEKEVINPDSDILKLKCRSVLEKNILSVSYKKNYRRFKNQ